MWQFQTLGEVLEPSFRNAVFSLFQGGITHVTLQFNYDEDNEEANNQFTISYDPATNDIHFDLEFSRMLGDALCFCQYKCPSSFGDVFTKTLTVSIVEKY